MSNGDFSFLQIHFDFLLFIIETSEQLVAVIVLLCCPAGEFLQGVSRKQEILFISFTFYFSDFYDCSLCYDMCDENQRYRFGLDCVTDKIPDSYLLL